MKVILDGIRYYRKRLICDIDTKLIFDELVELNEVIEKLERKIK